MGHSLTAQAKAKLKEIQGDIDKANTTLSQKQATLTELISNEEERRSRIVSLAAEEKDLKDSIERKRAEASGLDLAYGESHRKHLEAGDGEVSARKEKEKHQSDRNTLIKEKAVLGSNKTAHEREIIRLDKVKRTLETDVQNLNGDKVGLLHDLSEGRAMLAKIQARYERIKGAIEDALKQFQVFEKRIGRLSQETGYMISWEDPKELLEETE